MVKSIETVVIGAGQAGLSLSYELKRLGREHVLLEREPRLASAWRKWKWDSFTLVTPNWAIKPAGGAYAGDDPDGFMPRDEIVRYFEAYAASFEPPVQFETHVTEVKANFTGSGFHLETSAGPLSAANVVVATSLFQRPKIPAMAAQLPAHVLQIHSRDYKSPAALPPGAVLVVGSAQSGCQIADELHRHGRDVYLSVGSTGRGLRRYRGRDIFRWLNETGFMNVTFAEAPLPKSRYAGNPAVTGRDGGGSLNLHEFSRNGIRLQGRLSGAHGAKLRFDANLHEMLRRSDAGESMMAGMIDKYIDQHDIKAPPRYEGELSELRDGFTVPENTELDLNTAGIRTIIWANGYGFDFSWVKVPVFGEHGYPIQERGVTGVPGLYFLGMHWMHTRKSGLLLGVGDDAAHLALTIIRSAAN